METHISILFWIILFVPEGHASIFNIIYTKALIIVENIKRSASYTLIIPTKFAVDGAITEL